MTRSKEIVNEAFIERMMEHLYEGAIWEWKDTGHKYVHNMGMLTAQKKKGWKALRSIVGKEWFDNHVYPLGANLAVAEVALSLSSLA
jgi:hypothetical protein